MSGKSGKSSPDNFLLKMLQVPAGKDEEVRNFEVEVRGDNFYSKEVRKVMIRVYKPMTFVQTDKPIYLPGQTGNTGLIISQKTCMQMI